MRSLMKVISILISLISFQILADTKKIYTSEDQKFSVEKLTSKSGIIWGMDFLPENKIIFTVKSGEVFIFNNEDKSTLKVEGLPKVYNEGQGGLLDIKVHPEFSKNSFIYMTYSEPVGDKSTTALGRAILKGNKLTGFKKIFSAHEANENDIHFGSRIAFYDKHIFMSIGDRNERHKAQDLSFHNGKIIRIKEDGSIPDNNPFIKTKEAKPEIWSFGHRNPQGLFVHPLRNELWSVEFGPRGGDEVNLIKKGENYGWPVITYGREYYGPQIGEGTHKEGMVQPLIYWTPAISPSGFIVYNGEVFPKWKGNLFLANLGTQHLRRIVFEGTKPVKQEELLKELGYRFRHVIQGPDGLIYFSTDEGLLARLIKE